MGIADKIKNAAKSAGFYEETSKPIVSNSTPSNSVPSTPAANIPAQQFYVPVPPVAPVANVPTSPVLVDAEIANGLTAEMDKSAVPGFPQFKVILDTMNALPDAQRYPMALNILAASQKLTPENIVASLDDRLSILDQLDQQFESLHAQSTDEQVTKKMAEAEQLQQQIAEMEQKRVSLVTEAGQNKINLDRERATYAASSIAVRGPVSAERQRIAAFLTSAVQPSK